MKPEQIAGARILKLICASSHFRQATGPDRPDTPASEISQATDGHKVETSGDHHPDLRKLLSNFERCFSEAIPCPSDGAAETRNSVSLARLQETMERLSMILQEKNEILKKDLELTMKNQEIAKAQAQAAKAHQVRVLRSQEEVKRSLTFA